MRVIVAALQASKIFSRELPGPLARAITSRAFSPDLANLSREDSIGAS
jgi:hypothetical protein